MTVYGTYGSSLQQGDLAPGTAANAGEALPAYRSKQAEIGYKMALPRVDFSTAVFRLNRPFATTDPTDNVFKISGDQVNYGFEATLSGRVAAGSSSTADSRSSIQRRPRPAMRRPKASSSSASRAFKSNLLTEYHLPVGTGTFLSVNWQGVGRRPIDDINSTYTPAYNVVDLGVRYRHAIMNTCDDVEPHRQQRGGRALLVDARSRQHHRHERGQLHGTPGSPPHSRRIDGGGILSGGALARTRRAWRGAVSSAAL